MIGGKPAGLFFVSPGQINARIDSSVPSGPATVQVTSPSGTFTANITISINAAAGLFSIAGTGSSEGAILNAITYALGPFTVTSPMGPAGSPVGPTYLGIYLTGLNLAASPQVTIGGVSVPVFYFGNAPCCAGLEQINVQLTPQLAGAGRVPVVVTAAGVTSNVVSITILPNPTSNTPQTVPTLSGVVVIPNSTKGLVADVTDGMVEVVDTSSKKVVNTIRLPQGAAPGAIAINSAGTLAVVTEHAQNAVAFLNLRDFTVLGQANVGHGPVAVAIAGNRAFVVNQDSDTVTAIDLTSFVALSTITVGRAPTSISVDTARNRLLVTNTSSSSISMIDLGSLKVTATVALSLNARPLAVQVVPSVDVAVITDASLKPNQIVVVDLTNDTSKTVVVAGTQAGAWHATAVLGTKVFLTDPVDGVIATVTLSRDSKKQVAVATQRFNVEPGIQRLAVDSDHDLLLVTLSSGKVMLFDLRSNSPLGVLDLLKS